MINSLTQHEDLLLEEGHVVVEDIKTILDRWTLEDLETLYAILDTLEEYVDCGHFNARVD